MTLSDREYRIAWKGMNPIVTDMEGNPVNGDAVINLIKLLEAQYQPTIWLYFGKGVVHKGYKIGISSDPLRRQEELGIGIIHDIVLPRSCAWKLEKALHKTLKKLGLHLHGEWFDLKQPGKDWLGELVLLRNEPELTSWLSLHG